MTKVIVDVVECNLAVAPIVRFHQRTPRNKRLVDP